MDNYLTLFFAAIPLGVIFDLFRAVPKTTVDRKIILIYAAVWGGSAFALAHGVANGSNFFILLGSVIAPGIGRIAGDAYISFKEREESLEAGQRQLDRHYK